jgi:hypothetical protein
MKTMLMTSLLCATCLCSHAQGMGAMQPSECTLPEVAAAWRAEPGSVELQTDTVAPTVSGVVGRPYRVTLQPCAGKFCTPGTWAGLFPVTVPHDGRYRVAINDMSAWLDVFSAAGKNEGVMCEHAGCAPIRKIVQFDLKAGQQWVQIVTRKPAELDFLVVPVRSGSPTLDLKSH